MTHLETVEEVAKELAQETGVDAAEVKKILEHLGLTDALELVSKHVSHDNVTPIRRNRVVVGIRVANALIAR